MTMNGTSNGHTNGYTNGHSNGSASHADPKIIDLIKAKNGETFTSLEYFPPRTDDGVQVCLEIYTYYPG